MNTRKTLPWVVGAAAGVVIGLLLYVVTTIECHVVYVRAESANHSLSVKECVAQSKDVYPALTRLYAQVPKRMHIVEVWTRAEPRGWMCDLPKTKEE